MHVQGEGVGDQWTRLSGNKGNQGKKRGLGVWGPGCKGARNAARVYRNLCMRYTRQDWRHFPAHPRYTFDGYSTNMPKYIPSRSLPLDVDCMV